MLRVRFSLEQRLRASAFPDESQVAVEVTGKVVKDSSLEGAVYEAETDDCCICMDVRGMAAVGFAVRQSSRNTVVGSVGGGGWLCSSPEANDVEGVRVSVVSRKMSGQTRKGDGKV